MNTFYLLRHGGVHLDENKPPRQWILSVEGARKASELAESRWFRSIDVVYSSEEEKAFQTGQIIADSTGKSAHRIRHFNELKRDAFVEDYESAVEEAFISIAASHSGWESCLDALERFKEGMELINGRHLNSQVLIVSHGIILTLYFAHLKGEISNLFTRWKKLQPLSWGVVKDSTIVKDIVKQDCEPKRTTKKGEVCG